MNHTPRVCISAGHGLSSRVPGQVDPGADIVTSENSEADFASTFSKRVVRDLSVVFGKYKESYVFLRDEGAYAQADDFAVKHACDLFIEFHLNSGGGTGTEVLFNDYGSKPLALRMSGNVARALGVRDRGAKRRTDLAVLHPHSGMLSILAELFFADSKSDVNKYRDHVEATELAVVNTVLGQFGWASVKSLPRKWGRIRKALYRR